MWGQFNPIFFAAAPSKPNTFIGGVSATITSKNQLGIKLGISNTRVKNFRIIGSDIQCAITGGSYQIPANAFNGDTSITYFLDNDGLVTDINSSGFQACTNLVSVNFPKCTSISVGTGSLAFVC
jgi:hypothetical protein